MSRLRVEDDQERTLLLRIREEGMRESRMSGQGTKWGSSESCASNQVGSCQLADVVRMAPSACGVRYRVNDTGFRKDPVFLFGNLIFRNPKFYYKYSNDRRDICNKLRTVSFGCIRTSNAPAARFLASRHTAGFPASSAFLRRSCGCGKTA